MWSLSLDLPCKLKAIVFHKDGLNPFYDMPILGSCPIQQQIKIMMLKI